MSSSSSPIELTILSIKLQDSHVHHVASYVYVKKKKKTFFTLSFNLVKVQDCCMFKFNEICGVYFILSSDSGPNIFLFYR